MKLRVSVVIAGLGVVLVASGCAERDQGSQPSPTPDVRPATTTAGQHVPPCSGGISTPVVGAPSDSTSPYGNPSPAQSSIRSIQKYGKEHGDIYGGLVVDSDTGALQVGFTQSPCEHAAALRALVEKPELLRVYRARASETELEELSARLLDGLPELSKVGISGISVDIVMQAVVVSGDHVTPQAQRRAESIAGPKATLIIFRDVRVRLATP